MFERIAGLGRSGVVRYLIGVSVGLVVTMLLFLLMQTLIESDRSPFSEQAKGQVLEFVRLPEERELITKEPPVKPDPPEPPPEWDPPVLPPPLCGDSSCEGLVLDPPQEDPPSPQVERFRTDGEYLPIVKVAPVYPRRAVTRGIQGYVLLEFTVTAAGRVRDPVVVEASPLGVFDRAATDAALKFKYKPKVLNGQPMDVRGVRNLIRFELENG